MEERKEAEAADNLKVALMGPFAAIGDTVMAILMKPIFAVFAAGMALNGNWFGAILMLILGFIWFYLMFPGFWLGYNQGKSLINIAAGGFITKFNELASMAALIVVGGFIPSIIGLKTPLKFAKSVLIEGKTVQQVVELQTVLDSILPYMIPLIFVFLVYWLLKYRRWTILRVLLLLVLISVILGALGILA